METTAKMRPLFDERLIEKEPAEVKRLLVEYWSRENERERHKLADESFYAQSPELLDAVYEAAKECGQFEGQDDPLILTDEQNEKRMEARKKYNTSIETFCQGYSYYFVPLRKWLENVITEWKFRTMGEEAIRSNLKAFDIPQIAT